MPGCAVTKEIRTETTTTSYRDAGTRDLNTGQLTRQGTGEEVKRTVEKTESVFTIFNGSSLPKNPDGGSTIDIKERDKDAGELTINISPERNIRTKNLTQAQKIEIARQELEAYHKRNKALIDKILDAAKPKLEIQVEIEPAKMQEHKSREVKTDLNKARLPKLNFLAA